MSKSKFSQLLINVRESQDYWTESAILDFTEELTRLMEIKNVTRAELAKKIDSSPAYITKVLRGNVNFTLASMTKLALALDSAVHVHLSDKDAIVNWKDEKSYPAENVYDFGLTQKNSYNLLRVSSEESVSGDNWIESNG